MEQDINIGGIPAYIRETGLKNVNNPFSYQGIWVFTGAQGSGKTLLMMHCVNQMHKEYPKAKIVSNISIFGLPCIPYRGIEDFTKYNNGEDGIIFIIDEIQTMFSSLESSKMPVSTLTVWSQNRKNRRVILGTSQRFGRIAKGIREQCAWNYECARPIACFYRYRILDGADYDEQGKYIGEEPRYSVYVPKVKVMRMYNTMEVVNSDRNDN